MYHSVCGAPLHAHNGTPYCGRCRRYVRDYSGDMTALAVIRELEEAHEREEREEEIAELVEEVREESAFDGGFDFNPFD